MKVSYRVHIALAGAPLLVVFFDFAAFAVAAQSPLPRPFPLTVTNFAREAEACNVSSDLRIPDSAPGSAMLQKGFKTAVAHSTLGWSSHVFRWGDSPDAQHPKSIGKGHPHPVIQDYEATLTHLDGMVLNIFTRVSNGDGGLVLAMEVPSPCGPGNTDTWVEVDRARCSSRYPCALRLPRNAVGDLAAQPTRFRTRVIPEDEDYLTDFLEYERVTLDHDPEAVVAHEKFGDDKPFQRRTLRLDLSALLASSALSVVPVIKGASPQTKVFMRIRQPEPVGDRSNPSRLSLNTMERSDMIAMEQSQAEMRALENALQSYRAPWAAKWREPKDAISACAPNAMFEVGADQLYPGEAELEVWATGGAGVIISDVLVTTRASWAEAEVSLLDTVMKDHFALFNDPDEIVHGLPMDALKKERPGLLTDSNPCEWGYAMEAWVIMAETGWIRPEETVAKLTESFNTLEILQKDPSQFAHGLFYPYYRLRSKVDGEKIFPKATEYKELPCGDVALFYASMMAVQGWLTTKKFHDAATTCARIVGKMNFSHCVRETDCNAAGNGLEGAAHSTSVDKFWSVPLTFNAETEVKNSFNWNVWADEGGVVAMIVALNGALNDTQYSSVVRQQMRYSPCSHWEGVTVGHSAFFNSIFTLPTRSMLGFGTLFSSPYYHEFAVRTVLPSFRAHQKLKKQLRVDYMGPSDAMSMMPKKHPGKFFGSYAYWPPNNMYDCRQGKTLQENQCTWCKGIQYEGLDDPFDMIVPHGNMAAFLVSSMMEKSQFKSWLEDTKMLITDWSEVYTPGYGLEVVAPARRTPRGGRFEGAFDGRAIFESLSHGYTVLSLYEGLATMRRRFELLKEAGMKVPSVYEPPKYKPLSAFVDVLPNVRIKINKFLRMARDAESTEKTCPPSDY